MNVLYRDEELLVRTAIGLDRESAENASAFSAPGSDLCFVTFDSFTDTRTLERPGFGESFFLNAGIPAIHVISRGNLWYSEVTLPRALAAAAAMTARYSRVIAYGSSMGGYAALRYGPMAGAHEALALSPQFSIDPQSEPYDQRWAAHGDMLDWSRERHHPGFIDKAVLVYDPADFDYRHAVLYERRLKTRHIQLRYAGHPVTGFLAEIGMLSQLVQDLAADRLDPTAFEREAHARRRQSPLYLSALACRVKRSHHRVALARTVSEMKGRAPYFESLAAQAYALAGDRSQAEASVAHVIAHGSNDPIVLYRLSQVREAIDDLPGALDLILQSGEEAAAPQFAARRRYLLGKRLWPWMAAPPIVAPPVEIKTGFVKGLFQKARKALLDRKPPPAAAPYSEWPFDALTTTICAPPPYLTSWRRHLEIMAITPPERLQLLFMGDSIAHDWPIDHFNADQVVNIAVGADKIQHLLWRLEQIAGRYPCPDWIILSIGVNNMGDGDTVAGIIAGFERLLAMLAAAYDQAHILVLTLPPLKGGTFRDEERRAINAWLSKRADMIAVDSEAALDALGADGRHSDGVHMTERGYAALTHAINQIMMARIRLLMPAFFTPIETLRQ